MDEPVTIEVAPLDGPEEAALIAALNAELKERYPHPEDQLFHLGPLPAKRSTL